MDPEGTKAGGWPAGEGKKSRAGGGKAARPSPGGLKPSWLTVPAPPPEALDRMYRLLARGKLNTVCDWANCPNLGECYREGTATFLILGHVCTRNCAFCAVPGGKPEEPAAGEPAGVARAARELNLRHVVVTSVTRDDLPDGGAGHFARTVREIKKQCPGVTVEVLVPDFGGNTGALKQVVAAEPDVIGHNLETVPSLYPAVRPGAGYRRSLRILGAIKEYNRGIFTKSGLMVGLGEKEAELVPVFRDLREAGCDFLTIGQYLQPTSGHYPVVEYVPPEKFGRYRELALEAGFSRVISAPLARSSYHAHEMLQHM